MNQKKKLELTPRLQALADWVRPGARIADVEWPKGCLIVAVQRGAKELIPRGKTTLQMGDVLVAMTDEELQAGMNERLEGLCSQISMYTQASGVLYNEDRGQEQPEKSRR